ncbi:hypothetical protein NCLIV_040400 [Neospora caninum Liverpool]|uniref:UDP-N-acetylglucosamine diphosphorylase n=1 Tax=Neospora caninum (strain Liverpool) TaxID=572307 RepID=F0VBI1_NEOCL|nr:hypothetical protein NCLIV_040400 [Neospora caninum Liverpool]CBZ50965.1 hypothetical protein NCLIV_040400 [Neospora caninum Liverpool]CEL68267.1 TPA: Probable uridylyltransferase SA1974 [Neospora caninum Liverpool]|eukprot:XP_003880998.1 hypothetical protein NCLIV_040400 [Neospora caninum Liverpool]
MLPEQGDSPPSPPRDAGVGAWGFPNGTQPRLPACLDAVRCEYSAAQQAHVLHFLSQLSPSEQSAFARQLAYYDPCRVSSIFRSALKRHQDKAAAATDAQTSERQRSVAAPATCAAGSASAPLPAEARGVKSRAVSDACAGKAAREGKDGGNGSARKEGPQLDGDEASWVQLPSRCCRKTCFPPDVISWSKQAGAEDSGDERGDSGGSGESRDDGGCLASLYARMETSACPLVRLDATPERVRRHWFSLGLKLIRDGRVAVLVLAGGDGTRLGFSGPKGVLPAGPLSRKSIFQIFAERIRRLCQLAEDAPETATPAKHRIAEETEETEETEHTEERGEEGGSRKVLRPDCGATATSRKPPRVSLPLLIMTSERNDAQTRAFFAENDYFGLSPSTVSFFVQPSLPTFSPDGRILLQSPGCMHTAPNGNGGVFSALATSGLLGQLQRQGVVGIQVCSVDNLLAKVGDPLFFGICVEAKVPVGNKVLARRHPYEKVGVMCQVLAEPAAGQEEDPRGSEDCEGTRIGNGDRKGAGSTTNGKNGEERSASRRGRRRIPAVIEYSELPDEVRLARREVSSASGDTGRAGAAEASRTPAEKALLFEWGNVCLHYFDLGFISAVLRNRRTLDGAYHLAMKNVDAMLPRGDEGDSRVGPVTEIRCQDGTGTVENGEAIPVKQGLKLELFIFDVFALASRVLCVEVCRTEEFSPIKNASPVPDPSRLSEVAEDTLFSAQRDLSRLHCSWLRRAGVRVACSKATAKQPGVAPERGEEAAPRGESQTRENGEDGEETSKGKEEKEEEGQGFRELLCEISPCVSYGGEGLDAFASRGSLPSTVALPFLFEG